MVKRLRWLFVLVALSAVAGVAHAGVKTKSTPDTDFSAYKTYRWKVAEGPAGKDLDRQLRAAADEQLAKQGLKKVEAGGDADLELRYNAGSVDILVAGIDVVAGWWGDLVGVPGSDSNTTGGLVYAFNEVDTGKVVWTGWLVKRGTTNNALQVMIKRAPGWTKDILRKFGK